MRWMKLGALAMGLFLVVQAVQAGWTTVKRLTWTSHETYNLGMAADPSGNVHVVWEDGTIGDIEIYYRKGN